MHTSLAIQLFFAMCFILSVGDGYAKSIINICVTPETEKKINKGCVLIESLADQLREEVRKAGRVDAEYVVRILPGRYRLSKSIVIDESVWPRSSHGHLTIKGSGTTKTVILGSRELRIGDGVLRPDLSKNGLEVRQFSLRNLGLESANFPPDRVFGRKYVPGVEVFFNERRLPQARNPFDGFLNVESAENSGRNLRLVGVLPSLYKNEGAIQLGGFFQHDWADEVLSVSVTQNGEQFEFIDNTPVYGVKLGQRVWILNSAVDINYSGQWVFDPRGLNLLVASPASNGTLGISVVNDGLQVMRVRNISISDIGFEEFLDSAIRIDQSESISVKHVDVRNVGGTAIRISGVRVSVADVFLSHTGASGVSIFGGDRRSLARGENTLRDCRIEHVGRLVKSYAPAVAMYGVGNEISNCKISDGPHAAIVFHGNDHRIQGNIIERFMLETDDAGAIYTGRDWTERGTVISGNVLRHLNGGKVFGNAAIYLDDQASGLEVTGNLIVGGTRCVHIGGGRENRISSNIFVDCGEGVLIDARGMKEIGRLGDRANEKLKKKYVDVVRPGGVYMARYPSLVHDFTFLASGGGNVVSNNKFVNVKNDFRFDRFSDSKIDRSGNEHVSTVENLDVRKAIPDQLGELYKVIRSNNSGGQSIESPKGK